jgi:RecA/RadA recombinase
MRAPAFERIRTGLSGLDETLGGGLARGRTTLVVGSPGGRRRDPASRARRWRRGLGGALAA